LEGFRWKWLLFYCTSATASGNAIPEPTLDELIVTVLDTKVLVKAEKSKKLKAFTSGTALSQIAKRTRFAMAHAFSRSARKSLFDESSDDEVDEVDEQNDDQDDDCVEILLISLSGSRSKDTVDDCVDTPSKNVGHPQDSVVVDPSVGGPSSAAQATADLKVCKSVVDQFPTPTEEQVCTLTRRAEAFETTLVKAKEKSMALKKKSKSLTKALDEFIAKAAQLPFDLNDARQAEAESIVTLAPPPEVLFPKDIHSSSNANEIDLPLKEQNKDWVNALVGGLD
ncbi:hypothetical protein Tco_0962951, partial [Tanacetum coccineum]